MIGFWKLNKVFLDGVEVSFDNHEANLTHQYIGVFADKRFHRVSRFAMNEWATNFSWTLNADLLTVDSTPDEVYKVQSFGNSTLVLSPNARQNLKLEYVSISETDFPEVAFSAVIAGEAVSNTSTSVDVFGSSMQINGSTNSLFLAMSIPSDVKTGQQFSKTSTPPFSALIVKNSTDFGTVESGNLTVVKRTSDYIHVEFQFTVKQNTGAETISVTNGSIRAIID